MLEQTLKRCEVFLTSILFKVPDDKAENWSLYAAGRIFGRRGDVKIQIHFFLVSLGDYSITFNGESHITEVYTVDVDTWTEYPL